MTYQSSPKNLGENTMKKLTIIFAAIAICFGVSINAFAQQKGKPQPTPSDGAVISTIHDFDGSSWYSLRSDLLGSYKNGKDSTGTIESVFQGGGGDWVLNTENSTRTVFFDFGNAAFNGKPLTDHYPVRFITQCSPNFLATLTSVGATTTCPLIIKLDHTPGDDSTNLSLRFWTRTDYPGATSVTWTCTSLGLDNKCNGWQAQSSNDNPLTAQLLERKIIKNKITDTPIALYSFSFNISIVK